MTGPTDRDFHHEVHMMWQALRRRVPQPLRQQARLEYKLHYLVNLAIVVPQTVWDYSWTLYNAAAAWYYTGEQPQLAGEYRYAAAKAAIFTARNSLNMTAYQAGSFSARWGLFLNTVSRVSSRALLRYYEWCQECVPVGSQTVDMSLAHTLKHMACAIWLRARCIYLYAKVLFSYLIYKEAAGMGHELNTWEWNTQWRHTCCEILQAKLDIAAHELAMAAPGVARSFMFPSSAMVRRLVENRLLRSPFPQDPASIGSCRKRTAPGA